MGATAWREVVVGVLLLTLACKVNATDHLSLLTSDNKTVEQILSAQTFESLFPQRNNPTAHAMYFWTYDSFLDAAAMFKDKGFALVGGQDMQKRELAAFLAHVAHETTCGWSRALMGPYAWGLCYNQELSPSSLYCKPSYYYPCVNGVSYHPRGGFSVCGNGNYGPVGLALGFDGLHHPEYLSNNATLAFASAMWYWMTSFKPNPSPHEVMTGAWKPTKNDTSSFRYPGFGMTTNILAGQIECGHGPDPRGQDRISHYQTFLGYFNVDAGDNLDCGLQGMLPTIDSGLAFA